MFTTLLHSQSLPPPAGIPKPYKKDLHTRDVELIRWSKYCVCCLRRIGLGCIWPIAPGDVPSTRCSKLIDRDTERACDLHFDASVGLLSVWLMETVCVSNATETLEVGEDPSVGSGRMFFPVVVVYKSLLYLTNALAEISILLARLWIGILPDTVIGPIG